MAAADDDNTLTIKYAAYAKALPPQPIRVRAGGWGGEPQRMEDGSEPQPWHCLPFVEGAIYGLELVYPYETECVVHNDGGVLRFDFDYVNEPGAELTGGEFISFFPKNNSRFYIFNTRLDIQAPPGYVVRTEPHPRFFTDETGTVPLSMVGHVQTEWYARKFFVVFKAPPPGGRHVFRKGEPYVQLLFVPQRVAYDTVRLTPEEEARRRELDAAIDLAKSHVADNRWYNNAGNEFNNHYKIMARAFTDGGVPAVEAAVRDAMARREASLPTDKPIDEALAQGHRLLDDGKYEEAKAVYTHVLGRDPNNPDALSHLGIIAACTGSPGVGLKMMRQAIALAPHAPTYHSNLGEMLRLLGQLPDAEAAFRASLRIRPNDPGILSALGRTLAQQGRHADARAAYQAALALDPRSADAEKALRELPAPQSS